MHLAFIDIVTAYAADRPDQDAPLGGTTSAVCFLSRALVKAGIECTLFNKIREETTVHGVRALPMEQLIDERMNNKYDAFIFVGRWVDWVVKLVREGTHMPLIAWMHESTFNPELVPPVPHFDGVVFVSEWQQRINQRPCLSHWEQAVIRNAMNPLALDLFRPGEPVVPAKTQPPILLYAGATPRGAFHVPPLLDFLRPKQPEFTAEIYCDCSPSRDPAANAEYINWMRARPNVTHVGMVGQTELMQRLKRAAFMISPNPWPETSCIAMIEAMAAGLTVITTNRAVLPETAAGYALHVAINGADEPVRFDMDMPYEKFALTVSAVMDDWKQKPEETEKRLQAQMKYFKDNYRWEQRVKPWVDYVKSFS